MCGIAGFVSAGVKGSHVRERLEWMTQTLSHRGPDDSGQWRDDASGVALGHRRLSIVDLSPEGHQPMASPAGRFQLVFNGEIYNHDELRRQLEGVGFTFRGTSDTEVMLAAFERWGIDGAVTRFVGMFAFAVWDRRDRALHLVRDRLGEKPLYYGRVGDSFVFASELSALRAHPGWTGEIDRSALALLMRHNYVPAPHSIYLGIRKLPSGTRLALPLDRIHSGDIPSPEPYWSARDVAARGIADPLLLSDSEAVSRLDALLGDAVSRQMIADVPLGAFLSGGIDSSTVVALMQARSTRPVRTFTIGFDEGAYDEAIYARSVARHLGTDHTELYVTPQDALDVIPQLASIYDEPFSDSSQIPTFLVSKLARSSVAVCLSGDGGDELFCGYGRYAKASKLWSSVAWMPTSVRRLAARGIRHVPTRALDTLFGWAGPIAARYGRTGRAGERLHTFADLVDDVGPGAMYQRMVSHWKDVNALVLDSGELETASSAVWSDGALGGIAHRMMLADTLGYLPDDILVKVDRAAMAVSLETRVPFLDHRVVDFAWRLPMSQKSRDGKGKWLVRELLARYVPRELFERPKMGFGVPLDSWLIGPLRDWAESLLDERRLRAEGFFEPTLVRQKWREHVSGVHLWHYYLWDVLMFQQWLEWQRTEATCVT